MWIIKIGGSLLGSPDLAQWLQVIAKHADGKVVIVPGGGLFADAVRAAQLASNVSDAVAHQLALLAMDQFGLLLAGMNPALVTARSELEIAEYGWQHRGIIWLPSAMVLADSSIAQNWQVTSDSLSAWLAAKLGATQLVLVKSKSLEAYADPVYANDTAASVQTLIKDDLLDPQFSEFAAAADMQIWLLNKSNHAVFAPGLTMPALQQAGINVDLERHKPTI
jgi:aspartokinase-like uncharacterized kinase